jgi:hypothetical protein
LAFSQSVVSRNQSVAGYYDTLGWIYYKKELYSPAVEQLKKAVALDETEAKRSGNQREFGLSSAARNGAGFGWR